MERPGKNIAARPSAWHTLAEMGSFRPPGMRNSVMKNDWHHWAGFALAMAGGFLVFYLLR